MNRRRTGRLVLLDRDGVINARIEAGVRTQKEFELLPRALDAIAVLHRAGASIAVVTNQANIGRGLLTLSALDGIHEGLRAAVRARGGELDAIYACPHLPTDGCECRKPKPGMLLRAAQDLDCDIRSAVMVGDDVSDMVAAELAGCAAVLVGGHAADLWEAAQMIVGGAGQRLSEASVRAAICSPMASDAVAAGDGALSTAMTSSWSLAVMTKSSSNLPRRSTT